MDSTIAITVELDPHGRIVVVKRPSDALAERVRREARTLEAARHPGVVDLIGTTDSNGLPALVTRWVGPHTLAVLGSLPLAQASGIMAALADCVADLHELGIVHGAIAADHVIVSRDGRPVLCGFGQARLVPPDDPCAKAAFAEDVAGLGHLLREMVGEDVDLEPIPDRKGWRRKPRWQGYQRRSLLTLADQATHEELRLRPTARALAVSIHDSIPDARIGPVAAPPEIPRGCAAGGREADGGPGRRGRRCRRCDHGWRVARGVRPDRSTPRARPPCAQWSGDPVKARSADRGRVRCSGVAAVRYLRMATPGGSQPGAVSCSPGARRHDRSAADHTRRSRQAQPRPKAPVTSQRRPLSRSCPGAPRGIDLDADGCPDPVRVTDSVVEAAGIRYGIGRAGDRIAVGDWSCDGRATPALLRPGTGEVFVFRAWAARGRAITVRPTTRVARAASIEASKPDEDGCSELRIRTRGDRLVVVPVRSGP